MNARTRQNKFSRKRDLNTKFKVNKPLFLSLTLVGYFASMGVSSALFDASSALTYLKQKLMLSQVEDSFKVVVSQDSASANTLAEGYAKVRQKAITAESMILKKNRLIEDMTDFLGSGAATTDSKCTAVAQRNNEVLVPNLTNYSVNADLTTSLNNGLTNAISRQDNILQTASTLTCTLDLAKQGLCTPTGKSADYYDSDYTFFMNRNNLQGNQAQAVKAGLNNIADVSRDIEVTHNCGSDSNCTTALANDNRRIAVNSLVSYSVLNQLYNRMQLGGAN